MAESVKDKTVKGVGWSAIDNISRYGITFVVGIILARLLSPDDYGLIGIVTLFINIFNIIVDGGLGAALIRKQNATDADYSTLFFANLVVSIFLALVFLLFAPFIALFFKRPELTPIMRVMSAIVVVNSLTIVQKVRLTKKIDFKTQTKVSVISAIISGIIGIFAAYCGLGVWALVCQQISSSLFNSLFLWFYNRWIPKLVFEWTRFKEMWNFGWKLLVSSLLGSLWDDFYQIIIAKCYTPISLGLYTRSYQFASICSSNINAVVQRVSYPVLCTMQDDKLRLKAAYSKFIRVTMLPTFALMLGLSACSEHFIFVVLGEKWMACVPFLQIICFRLMLYPVQALNINIMEVYGRTDLVLKLRIIKLAIACIPLIVGIFFNIYYMLWSSVAISFVSYFINVYASYTFIDYSAKEQLLDLFPSFGLSAIMAGIVYGLSFLPITSYILLPLQIVIGMSIMTLLCEKTHLDEYLELKAIVIQYSKKIKK